MLIKKYSFLLIFCSIVLTFILYYQGLNGSFYFDDNPNIVYNQAIQINTLSSESIKSALHSGHAGKLGRPIAMLSFALNYYHSGLSPYYYKLTNLFIHLLSGIGLLLLSRQLLLSLLVKPNKNIILWVPLLAASLWLIHPLNLTTVLYIVQRMAGLSALFCIWGMLCYVLGRLKINNQKQYGWLLIAISFFIFFPLALYSKENAALFPIYCFLIEFFIFKFITPEKTQQKILFTLYGIILFIPLIIILGKTVLSPQWLLSPYQYRDFTLSERIFTELRVIVFYLKSILAPVNSELGLNHDDFIISTSLFKPVSTFFAGLFIIFLLTLAFIVRHKQPILSFGILFFFSAHLIESTIISLELIHEHRNYLADFGILLIIAYYLIQFANQKGWNIKTLFPVIVIIVYLSITTLIRADIWSNYNVHALIELNNHPDSPRTNYWAGRVYAILANSETNSSNKKIYINKAKNYFINSSQLNHSYTDGLFGMLMLHGIEHIPLDKKAHIMLIKRLANGSFSANNYNHLNAIFNCIKAKACQFKPSTINEIMTASSKNSLFSGGWGVKAQYNQYKLNSIK